jgi:hypothetical protein
LEIKSRRLMENLVPWRRNLHAPTGCSDATVRKFNCQRISDFSHFQKLQFALKLLLPVMQGQEMPDF